MTKRVTKSKEKPAVAVPSLDDVEFHTSKAAHVASHRPVKRHPRTVKHLSWALPVFAGVIGLVLALGVVLAYQQRRTDVIANLAPRHARITTANQAKTDLYDIKLGELRTVETDQAFTPEVSQNIVIVPVELTNRGKSTYNFFPSIQTYIRDSEGSTYTMHPTIALKDPLPAGELTSGKTLKGELSYAIPKTLQRFRIYFDMGWGDMAPAVFEVNR